MNVMYKEIGTRIRQARAHAGLSQRALAQLLDIDQGSVSRWERGARVPTVPMLFAIAEYTGREPSWFLTKPKPAARRTKR